MEKKQYPDQEPEELLQPDLAPPAEAPETPAPEHFPEQEVPAAPEEPEHLDVEALFAPIFEHTAPVDVPEEVPPVQDVAAADEEPVSEEPASAETADEAADDEPADPRMAAPQMGQEIEADDAAMVGMLAHGEPEPPFDLSILDDPELDVPQEPDTQGDVAEEADSEDTDEQEYRDNGEDQQAAPQEQRPVPPRPRPLRKGRPKRKKGEGLLGIPSIAATLVWLALILAIGVTAGRMLWVCAADVLAFGREDKPVTITIYESDSMESIVDKLYDAGLIRYKSLFNLYASISDAQEDIQPGIYDLNTRYDYHALVNFMSPRSSREVVQLTIPEGYTCRQIFKLLEENRICTARDIAAYAATGELEPYWFLEQVERGSEYCLEGFLFPDTYQFYKNSSPKEALEKMLDNFDYRFSEEMRAQLDPLNANVTGGNQPGIYDLNTRYDYHALVNFMSPRSSREVVQLTIPEGYTCRQIFKLLEENRICTARDIAAYAATGELEPYWFLEQVERGSEYCLEGFLFPDTYQFYKNSSPKEALEKMLDNFDYRFSEEMRAQLDPLNANVTGGNYGVREVTIVASLIEKESAAPAESPAIAGVIYNRLFRWGDTPAYLNIDAESPAIAGVIYNRLFRWGDTPAYLNIDASLVYAQGGDNSTIDTSIDSPYNTYTHTGLTPTPIANPGLSSLKAALDPEMHEYYYYVLNPSTGMHQFSKTYEEHEANRTSFAAAAKEGLG